MSKGMYLNSKDLSFVSKVLWSEISSLRVILKNNNDESFVNDFKRSTELFCKIEKISMDHLNRVFDYLDIFTKYTHHKSFGIFSSFEKTTSVDYWGIYSENSYTGFGLEDRSVFVNDVFYPYGIDRKDVYIEFKNL